ncbi:pantothenate kinase type III [Mycoplasmoides fastidiosum]|uniref:Type III pantothenate kinase n=1 Tax=Mycoplasmoides fastidiosum TaxID=92758 RepID=A0ABU0LZX7_9BACT|nr:type III pantothenate kinase [Mycoplasmoides fastidiosum]MDQ0514257.1 pantothenate kinase type III [Mycoplasmoides fastidiosum]UUD37335.1 type III pantothenate kinase [Mycoplasmoides fastidiosum]
MSTLNLYIDIGNTNTKIYVENTIAVVTISNTQIVDQTFFAQTFWQSLITTTTIYQTYIASVNPNINEILAQKWTEQFQLHFLNFYNQNLIDFPGIQNPESKKYIGADLIAAAIATNQIATEIQSPSAEFLIVIYGTSSVYLHQKHHQILGAGFNLGIKDSLQTLLNRAALLDKNTELNQNPPILGNNTIDALSIGILGSQVLVIESYLQKLQIKPDHLIVSGGDYFLAQELLNQHFPDHLHQSNIVIEGLKIWAQHQKYFH